MANDCVKLKVGGILYTTSKATLTRYPDSMLGTMFTGSVPSTQDDDGCFLIDRDGQIFRHILNFLRCGKLVLPNSFDEHDLLLSEAEFYQITLLVIRVSDSPIAAKDFVKLSVGGILYKTTKATLTRYPNSMLGAMFTGSVPSTQDDDGCFLIDRDGQIFRHILNFLRCGKLVLPNSFDEHDLLLSEADFYQITPLANAIQCYFRESEKEKNVFSFYSVEVYESKYSEWDAVSGTIESLLQLPSSLLSDATRETLKLRVPHSTLSALRMTFPSSPIQWDLLPIATRLLCEGWTSWGKQASYITSTRDYLHKSNPTPDIYLKQRL